MFSEINNGAFLVRITSRKTLSRQKSVSHGSGDSISHALLGVTKQSAVLNALDKSAFKSSDKALIAYNHRKRKFAAHSNEFTHEGVERFVGSVLNGDIQFTKARQKPELRRAIKDYRQREASMASKVPR